MVAQIQVLIADVLPILSESVSFALNRQFPELFVLGEHPANGPETIKASARLRPDVALVDYWMPEVDGSDLAAAIRTQAPRCKVLLFSWVFGNAHIERGLEAGAAGFVSKGCSVAEVADAIVRAHHEESRLNSPEFKAAVAGRLTAADETLQRFRKLTGAELEILALLSLGKSYQQIADRLCLAQKTVRNRISRMLMKTGTQSQNELVAKARGCGFFPI